MPPHLPIWTQRLSPELRRRIDFAVAAAAEARSDTHAQQALNLVTVLAPRMPFYEAVERYIETMSLGGEEAETVRNRALVAISDGGVTAVISRQPERAARGLDRRYLTPLGAVRFVRRHLRRSAEEDLWMELAAARAEEALIRTHIKHATAFVAMLSDAVPPTRAANLYLDQLGVPSVRAKNVYQRVLARVAEAELPKLVGGHVRHPARDPE